MKMRFLVSNLLCSFLICGSLLAVSESKNFNQIKCSVKHFSKKNAHRSGPNKQIKSKGLGKPIVYSTNWSGYAAENNFKSPAVHSVKSVKGSWIVPAIAPSESDTYCAIWAGIDGFSNTTVEQIGTAHDWVSGSLEQFAWFEMYPAGAFQIVGFPVNTGDEIKVSIKYAGNDTFLFKIYNVTQQVFFKVPTSYTKSSKAKRQSAEWIVEGPVQPLSNFSPVQFGDCTAIVSGQKEVIGCFPHTPIEMVSGSITNPIAIPSPIPSILFPKRGFFFVTRQPEQST